MWAAAVGMQAENPSARGLILATCRGKKHTRPRKDAVTYFFDRCICNLFLFLFSFRPRPCRCGTSSLKNLSSPYFLHIALGPFSFPNPDLVIVLLQLNQPTVTQALPRISVPSACVQYHRNLVDLDRQRGDGSLSSCLVASFLRDLNFGSRNSCQCWHLQPHDWPHDRDSGLLAVLVGGYDYQKRLEDEWCSWDRDGGPLLQRDMNGTF
ncbi:uncharacterized protein J3D65DRAFT_459573 [Phyllosticta citribraziliensis]|uniref:Uncharacterized protein n=1 Tax=Phyllosticta citribraziliensis TaxID=989973 RepID=A0ABR1LF64_9PEZI